MKILRRKSPEAEGIDGYAASGVQVIRRIQITQERETISVLVRGRAPSAEGKQAVEIAGQEPDLAELSPSVEEPDRDRP
jgi:hypothetical protein